MIAIRKSTQGVYVEFKDRLKRKKSECCTLSGVTPKQAMKLFVQFVRDRQHSQETVRKAG